MGAEVTIPVLVCYILYWIALLVILIAWPLFRKKNPNSKGLIGWIFGASVSSNLIAYSLGIVGLILGECRRRNQYEINIASTVFGRIALFCLLYVVLLGINTHLRDRLESKRSISKLVIYGTLAFMALLTIASISITCYALWAGENWWKLISVDVIVADWRLAVAYWALYLVVVIMGGVFATRSLLTLRSRRTSSGLLATFVGATFFSMFTWALIKVIRSSNNLAYNPWTTEAYVAVEWLSSIFQVASYILILLTARVKVQEPALIVKNHEADQQHQHL